MNTESVSSNLLPENGWSTFTVGDGAQVLY